MLKLRVNNFLYFIRLNSYKFKRILYYQHYINHFQLLLIHLEKFSILYYNDCTQRDCTSRACHRQTRKQARFVFFCFIKKCLIKSTLPRFDPHPVKWLTTACSFVQSYKSFANQCTRQPARTTPLNTPADSLTHSLTQSTAKWNKNG